MCIVSECPLGGDDALQDTSCTYEVSFAQMIESLIEMQRLLLEGYLLVVFTLHLFRHTHRSLVFKALERAPDILYVKRGINSSV